MITRTLGAGGVFDLSDPNFLLFNLPVSPANLRGEKVTNFLLARRGHQGDEALFVYRYTLAVVGQDGRGVA
jgi:hypothetical protein